MQIRLLDGSSVTENFGAKEPLSAVRLFLELNYPNIPQPFSLMTAYPRREFQGDDFNCPLEALGKMLFVLQSKESLDLL